MNIPPGWCSSGLLPEWILAPVYSEQPSTALPVWPAQQSTEISLSLPTMSPYPHFSAVQTLVDLGFQKSRQCHARPEAKELPFSVVKPKAIRLYDIHIGVESRLPVTRSQLGFDLIQSIGDPKSVFSCGPASSAHRNCGNERRDIREATNPLGIDLASCIPPPLPAVLKKSTCSNHVKKQSSPCSCLQRNSPDAGHSERTPSTSADAPDIVPFCIDFPAQSPSQTLIGPQLPTYLGQPVLPFRAQHLLHQNAAQFVNSQTIPRPEDLMVTKKSGNRWCGADRDQVCSVGPLPLPTTISPVCERRDNMSVPHGVGHHYDSAGSSCSLRCPSTTHFSRHAQTRFDRHQSYLPRAQLVKEEHPCDANLGGRPLANGHQKLFLHPWEQFVKDGNARGNPHSQKSLSKTKEKREHRTPGPTVGTKMNYPYSFSSLRKTGKGKVLLKNGLLMNRRTTLSTEVPKHYKRAYRLNKAARMRKQEDRGSCSFTQYQNKLDQRLPSTAAGQFLPFQDNFPRIRNPDPSSEPMSADHALTAGPSSNVERKMFKCPQCRYLTDRKNNLKRHIVTMHHTSSKTLECCGIAFQSKAALRDHNSVFHRGGYRCSLCARNFCRKALLRRHLTVHSGQKDFFCERCGYATSHKSNLERHQKVHEKKEECSREMGQMKNPDDIQCGAYTANHANVQFQRNILNFQEGVPRSHYCNGDELLDSHMLYPIPSNGYISMQSVLEQNLSTSNENMQNDNFNRGQKMSPEKLPCERYPLESETPVKHRSATNSSATSVRPTNFRNRYSYKARRTRGLLSKRIRDTYKQHKTPRVEERELAWVSQDNRHKSEGESGAENVRKDRQKMCESLLRTEYQEQPEELRQLAGDYDTPKRPSTLERDRDDAENNTVSQPSIDLLDTPSNGDTDIKDRDDERNAENNSGSQPSIDLLDTPSNGDTDIKDIGLSTEHPEASSASSSQQSRQQTEPRSLTKRSKQGARRRLCDVLYSCAECRETFSTQPDLGEHKCLSSVTSSPYSLPLVTTYQKGGVKQM